MEDDHIAGSEVRDAMRRLRDWETQKDKCGSNTDWWRDFHLSPNHSENHEHTQALLRKAADAIAAEDEAECREREKQAERWKAINDSPAAKASRRAENLRVLFVSAGHVCAAFLIFFLPALISGKFTDLYTLWFLDLFATPICYALAVAFSYRATSLWKQAQQTR
jgi:cation transport ATPase